MKHYKWAEKDWVLNLKMNGPSVMPVIIRPKVKKFVGSKSDFRNDLIKKHSEFA